MKALFKSKSSSFLVNTFQLITGTVIAQLIPLLLQPILRRLYTPQDFGVMAIYLSIVGVLCMVVNLGYQKSIVLPDKDEDAMSIVMGSVVISVIMSIAVLVIFQLFSSNLIHILNLTDNFKFWIWFLPLSIFFNAVNLILSNWLIRKKGFKQISQNKIIRRSAEGASQTSIGFFGKAGGLIGGAIIGDFAFTVVYLYQYFKTGGLFNLSIWKNIKRSLIRYKDFPLISLGPTFLDTLSTYIPVFLVTTLYTNSMTGQFDLSRQILAIPLALIAASFSQVLLQDFTEMKKKQISIKKRFFFVFKILTIFSIAMCLFIYFFGKPVILFIFGSEWLIGAKITVLLVWAYAMRLIISPLTILFIVFEKLKVSALWQICYFAVICSLFFVHIGFNTFIVILVAIDCIMYAIYGILTYMLVFNYEKSIKSA